MTAYGREYTPSTMAELDGCIGKLPEHTCGAIDEVKKALVAIEKAADRVQRMEASDLDDIHSRSFDIEYDAAQAQPKMENLRAENAKLREHAEYWRKECEELIAAWPKAGAVAFAATAEGA